VFEGGRLQVTATQAWGHRSSCVREPNRLTLYLPEIYFLPVEDGKFVAFWGLEDDLARLQQLGLIPSLGQPEEASPT
jgi:hypothetical protein